jgi:uncharacterized protein
MPLASVGRLALTNYLLHAFIIASVSYSWGFGLYGKMGPAQGLLIVAVAFPLMVLWSGWWMRRFRFGPCEWVWRSLTYGKLPPMRLFPRKDSPVP